MHLQLCTTSNSEQEDTSTDIKLEKQAQEIMKDILSLQTRLENLNKENQQVYEGANKRVTEINKQGNLYLKKLEDQQFSFKQEVLMRLEKIRAKYYPGLI